MSSDDEINWVGRVEVHDLSEDEQPAGTRARDRMDLSDETDHIARRIAGADFAPSTLRLEQIKETGTHLTELADSIFATARATELPPGSPVSRIRHESVNWGLSYDPTLDPNTSGSSLREAQAHSSGVTIAILDEDYATHFLDPDLAERVKGCKYVATTGNYTDETSLRVVSEALNNGVNPHNSLNTRAFIGPGELIVTCILPTIIPIDPDRYLPNRDPDSPMQTIETPITPGKVQLLEKTLAKFAEGTKPSVTKN